MRVTPSGSPESRSNNHVNRTHNETTPRLNDNESSHHEKRGWIKYATAGGTAIALVATAAVLFTRGEDKEPIETPRTPGTSAPATPGVTQTPESPSPSVTPTERLSDLEQQRELFERLQVPAAAASKEEFVAYMDVEPNALEAYKAFQWDGGLNKVIANHNLSFNTLRPKNLADAVERNNDIYTGFHLDVVDGKLTIVKNTTLMDDGITRSTLSKKVITAFSKDNGAIEVEERQTPIHIAAAGLLVMGDDSETTIRLAADLVKSEERVAKYRKENSDDKTSFEELVSEFRRNNPGDKTDFNGRRATSSIDMISSAYASDVSIPQSTARKEEATRLARGEIQTITIPNFMDSRIVRVHQQEFLAEDGKTDLRVLGVTLIGKDSGSYKPFIMTLALVPAEYDFKYDLKTKKNKLVEVPDSDPLYHAMLVSKTYSSK